jgi:heat shock protein HslJ
MQNIKVIPVILLSMLLFSCGNKKNAANFNEAEAMAKHAKVENPDFSAKLKEKGVHFDVQFNEKLVLTIKDKKFQIYTTDAAPLVAAGTDILQYSFTTDYASVTVIIDVQPCKDGGQKVDISYTDKSSMEITNYSLCGNYAPNKSLLHKWELQSVNDIEVNPKLFEKERPFITFSDEKGGTIGGFGGCNRFGGSFNFTFNGINPSEVMATKMFCEDTADLEAAFLSVLNAKFVKYHFNENGGLTLESINGTAHFIK